MGFLIWETKKIFRDTKTHLGFCVILVFLALMCLMFKWDPMLKQIAHHCHSFGIDPHFFMNGYLFCRLSTMMMFLCILPVVISVSVVGQFAGEESEGFLKTFVGGPKSRSFIFFQKFIAAVFFAFVYLCLTFFLSWVIGVAVFGRGELVVSGTNLMTMLASLRTITESEAVLRIIFSLILSMIAVLPLMGLNILLSVLLGKPMAALSVTLSFVYGTLIFKFVPFQAFESLGRYFFTSEFYFWGNVFQEVIPWHLLLEKGLYLTAYAVSFLMLSWGIFQVRDIKS